MIRATYDIEKLKELVPEITGKTRTVGEGGLSLTVQLILQTINDNIESFKPFAEAIQGKNLHETVFNIWHFLKTETVYTKDKTGFEEIRSPQRLFSDKIGDCDDYTIFAATILKALGYDPKLMIVGFESSSNYAHIYAVLDNYVIDGVMNTFNEHPENINKFLLVDLNGKSKEFFRNPKTLNMSNLVIQSLSGLPQNEIYDTVNNEYSRLLGLGEQLTDEEKQDLTKLRILKVLEGSQNPHRQFIREIMPDIAGIDENLNVYFEDDDDRAEVEQFLDDYLRLDGLGNVDELGKLFEKWRKNKVKRVAKRRERRKKIKEKITNALRKVGKASQKVGKFLKKTTLAPARGAMLLLLKMNFNKWGSRLWLSYIPKNQWSGYGINPDAMTKVIEFRKKFVSFFVKSGGKESAIKKAISKRGAKVAKQKYLSGLGSLAIAGGTIAAATPFLTKLKGFWDKVKGFFGKLFKKETWKKAGEKGKALYNEFKEANTETVTDPEMLNESEFFETDNTVTDPDTEEKKTNLLLPLGIVALLAFIL